MNSLTAFQRKIAYLVAMVPPLMVILWLGMPAGRDEETGDLTSGGKLSQLRQEYELGETSLGNVDPASSTMSLVLLGARGPAVNYLWQQAIEFRDQKQWAQLRSTVDSIILLQPHFVKVWDFQGWNLAYNVSAEWDAVADRYYWVKEGGKFLMDGTARNRRSADLAYYVSRVTGPKVGQSDEWEFFRKYWLNDPNDEKFGDKPDPDFNRGAADNRIFPDNYLAARDWRLESGRRDAQYPSQHVMAAPLFRSLAPHSFMEMANALQKEGLFDENDLARPEAVEAGRTVAARTGWQRGAETWISEFGRYEFPSEIGPFSLETNTEEEFRDVAQRNSELLGQTVTVPQVKDVVDRTQNMTNYRYWRERAKAEALPETAAAHREIYQGQQAYQRAELGQARELLISGMKKLEATFEKFPDLQESDSLAVEEALLAMVYVRAIYNLNQQPLPDALPMTSLWEEYQGSPLLEDVQRQFRTQTRSL